MINAGYKDSDHGIKIYTFKNIFYTMSLPTYPA